MASRVGRGGQSGEQRNHSHAGPAPRQQATCPASWIERVEWVGDTTASIQAEVCRTAQSPVDGGCPKPIAYLLSQTTYSRHVLRSSCIGLLLYTLSHRPTSTNSSWHVKYALASLRETGQGRKAPIISAVVPGSSRL